MYKSLIVRANALTIAILFVSVLNAQTVINYEAWNGSTGCNIFASAVNVPATINGTNGNVPHLSTIGQPEYYGSPDNSVSLRCKRL